MAKTKKEMNSFKKKKASEKKSLKNTGKIKTDLPFGTIQTGKIKYSNY